MQLRNLRSGNVVPVLVGKDWRDSRPSAFYKWLSNGCMQLLSKEPQFPWLAALKYTSKRIFVLNELELCIFDREIKNHKRRYVEMDFVPGGNENIQELGMSQIQSSSSKSLVSSSGGKKDALLSMMRIRGDNSQKFGDIVGGFADVESIYFRQSAQERIPDVAVELPGCSLDNIS